MRVFLVPRFEKYLCSGLIFLIVNLRILVLDCPNCLFKMDHYRQCCHTNIVELTDVVQSDGRLYLVFEFVDRDLKKLFDATEGLLPPAAVLSYTRQLLEGLNYCHVRGIMHR